MKFCFLFTALLFCLISCTKSSQNSQPFPLRPVDSAYYFYDLAKNEKSVNIKLRYLNDAGKYILDDSDTLIHNIYNHQIYYFTQTNVIDSAIYYSNLMINHGLKFHDTNVIANGYYRKAKSFLRLNKNEEVLKNMYESQKYHLLAGDSVSASKRLVELANAQLRMGDFVGSQENATKALKYLKEEDSTFLLSAYNVIAVSMNSLGDPLEAIREYEHALKYTNSQVQEMSIKNNIAQLYVSLKYYDRALENFEMIAKEVPIDSREWRTIMDNYYFTLWLKNEQDVSQKLKYLVEKRKDAADLEGLISSYKHLSQYYQDNDREESRNYAKLYYIAAKDYNDHVSKIDALKNLIVVSEPELSRDFSLKYISLRDSIDSAQLQAKNVFAKIKYDEDEKNKKIENLELVSYERRLAFEKEKTEKLLILFVLIILILTSLLIYKIIRQKHKKDTIRQIYSTEARLSKKVHDELANDLFIVMAQLSEKDVHIVNQLENVYQRTRDISKENSLINTTEAFSDELKGMINGTIAGDTKTIISGFQDIQWDFYKKEQKIVIYRTIQELLVNFRKHSHATILVLKFEEDKSKLRITYKDNGIGADLKRNKFSGLHNMENRIHAIGGNINFHSENKKGFLTTIHIPI